MLKFSFLFCFLSGQLRDKDGQNARDSEAVGQGISSVSGWNACYEREQRRNQSLVLCVVAVGLLKQTK